MRAFLPALLLLSPVLVAADGEVHEQLLENGLKVIVKEDHRAPVVSSQIWYKVGSSYERGGQTGISHALEHMMFKGTDELAPGEFSRIIAAHGGEENAFTGRDYTAYFQNLAKDRLAVSFELEADRMRDLALPEEEFRKELEVIKEERRLRTDDDPESLTFEVFNATAYIAAPYRNPVIGWGSDIAGLTVADLRDWYNKWYAPNNATLVVVGDVDPSSVFALARTHFGPLAAEEVPLREPTAEPPQRGEKRVRIQAPAKEPYLLMGYHTTALAHAESEWEPYALEVLASVLDGGNSARLPTQLVRGQEIAASAGASYGAMTRLPSMLLLDGIPAKGQDVASLEQALRDQIARLRADPVADEELERIRNQLVAAKVYERDSVFYQGMQIGRLESVGLDWRLQDEYLERIEAVTPEQVQAVARKYLTPEALTVAILEPQPLDAAPRPTTPAGGHHHVH